MNEHVQIEHRVNRSLSPSDAMYGGNPDHYFSVGSSALANIKNAVAIAETDPHCVLDFGCGAGRVTRWLAAAFPQAEIEACDIRQADLKFVAETFGARIWVSGTDVAELKPPSSYDLIWVGSVFHASVEGKFDRTVRQAFVVAQSSRRSCVHLARSPCGRYWPAVGLLRHRRTVEACEIRL
jgi:SAM-dependent methyltransferase